MLYGLVEEPLRAAAVEGKAEVHACPHLHV